MLFKTIYGVKKNDESEIIIIYIKYRFSKTVDFYANNGRCKIEKYMSYKDFAKVIKSMLDDQIYTNLSWNRRLNKYQLGLILQHYPKYEKRYPHLFMSVREYSEQAFERNTRAIERLFNIWDIRAEREKEGITTPGIGSSSCK